MTDPAAHNPPSERDDSWPPSRPLPLDADAMREVLDGAARALIVDLGLRAEPDVVAAQLDEHVCNLVLRLRRVEVSRDSAERNLRDLAETVHREHLARMAWLATLPDGSCGNPPPRALLDAEEATRAAVRRVK
jgi:hypothetical protein